MRHLLKVTLVISFILSIGYYGYAKNYPKVLSIEGKRLEDWKTAVEIHEIAVRYMLFILEANEHINHEHYYIIIMNKNSRVDPPKELFERLKDIDLKFSAASEYVPEKRDPRKPLSTMGPPCMIYITIGDKVPDHAYVEVASGSIGVIFHLHWDNGTWVMEESDGLIVR